jgi:hypothetical protein
VRATTLDRWIDRDAHAGTVQDPEVRDRAGLPWDRVSPPSRWHRCSAWTIELWWTAPEGRRSLWPDGARLRCACGGVQNAHLGSRWIGRNSRRVEGARRLPPALVSSPIRRVARAWS